MDYIAYLHKDPDSDFGVSFPDFPVLIRVLPETGRTVRINITAREKQGIDVLDESRYKRRSRKGRKEARKENKSFSLKYVNAKSSLNR